MGENPLEPERVSEKLHANTFWMGRGGSITHTISGIDIAMWDILGKVTGQPVGRLLGGRYRERVMPYASILMDGAGAAGGSADARSGRRVFARSKSAGGRSDGTATHWTSKSCAPRAMRWAPRRGSWSIPAAAMPSGPEITNGRCARPHMLAAYDVYWFEEPLRPDDLDDFVLLRRHSPVPIAGGEVLTRRQSFAPWLRAGAFDIVQPDVTKVGGISEERRIAWMAEECGVRFIPHGWNTALGLAADLQLASANARTDMVEYLAGSPFIDELPEGGWRLDADGMLPIPDGPGLGIQLNADAVERHTGMRLQS